MKNNMKDIRKSAKELVANAKKKNLIESYTVAFKDFPVKEENHKGKREHYCK